MVSPARSARSVQPARFGRPVARASAFVLLAALAASCDEAERPLRERGDFTHGLDDTLRMNQLQMLATHNSYHVRLEPTAIVDWQYDMAPLDVQLAEQGVRGFELDIHWDPEASRYRVLHIDYLDDGSTCATLVECLSLVRAFSDANPGHHPIAIQIEMKVPAPQYLEDVHLTALDAELRSVFPDELLVTPRDLRGTHASVREAVVTSGWPTLGASRGRTFFYFDCDREVCLRYAGDVAQNDTRVMFADGEVGDHHAAVMVYNGADAGATALVDQGFMVRVFADSIADVLGGTNELDAALATGAQILSSDVPAPRTDVSYVADIPGGTPSRCNPRNAPVGCLPEHVENPAYLQGR